MGGVSVVEGFGVVVERGDLQPCTPPHSLAFKMRRQVVVVGTFTFTGWNFIGIVIL